MVAASDVMNLRLEYLADHGDAIPTLALWSHRHWSWLTPERTLAEREERLQARAHRGGVPTALVAMLDDRVVGSAALVECDLESHCDLSPWLASVLVAPAHRGQGIGSALAHRVLEESRRLGFYRTYLFTFDRHAFYRRLGWSAMQQASYRGHPVTVMVG